ncbi:MAG: hypothetical protein RBS56_03515 [Candidatus Gracilibacteria bacterium]|jgi:hypothetical protein|nr:hypothetical protein [Candidatus Gracilibacteria bacterium]
MFRKFLALIFSFVFILFFLVFAFISSFENTFFDKSVYLEKDFVSRSYNYILDFSYDLILEKYGENIITEGEFLNLFSSAFTEEDLKNEISKGLDSVLSSEVNPETFDVEIVFPLDFLKNYKEKINPILATHLFKSLPKCSIVESLNLCVPDLIDFSLFNMEFEREIERFFYNSLPQDFSIVWHVGSSYSGNLLDVYNHSKFYVFSFSILCLFALLCLISIILFSPVTLIIKWIFGVLLLSSSLSFFVLSYFVKFLFIRESVSQIFAGNGFVLSVMDLFFDKFFKFTLFSLLPIAIFSAIFLSILIIKEFKNGKI